jgi:hypothetical protein
MRNANRLIIRTKSCLSFKVKNNNKNNHLCLNYLTPHEPDVKLTLLCAVQRDSLWLFANKSHNHKSQKWICEIPQLTGFLTGSHLFFDVSFSADEVLTSFLERWYGGSSVEVVSAYRSGTNWPDLPPHNSRTVQVQEGTPQKEWGMGEGTGGLIIHFPALLPSHLYLHIGKSQTWPWPAFQRSS